MVLGGNVKTINWTVKHSFESVQVDPGCGDCEYRIIETTFAGLGFGCSKSDLERPMWDEESASG